MVNKISTELDGNSRAILKTVKDILKEQGMNASFSDTIRYLAKELGIEPSVKHLEHEVKKNE